MPPYLAVGLVAGQPQLAIGYLTFALFTLAVAWLFQFLLASSLLSLPWAASSGNAVLARRIAAGNKTATA